MNERHLLVDTIIKTEHQKESDNRFKIKSSDIISVTLILIGITMIFRPDNFNTQTLSLVLGVLFVYIGLKRE